jgi:hypothetical protein
MCMMNFYVMQVVGCPIRAVSTIYAVNATSYIYNPLVNNYNAPVVNEVLYETLINDRNLQLLNFGQIRMTSNAVRFLITGDTCYNDIASSLCRRSMAYTCATNYDITNLSTGTLAIIDPNQIVLTTINYINNKDPATQSGTVSFKDSTIATNIQQLVELGRIQAVQCTTGCTPNGFYSQDNSLSLFKICYDTTNNILRYKFRTCGGNTLVANLYGRQPIVDAIYIDITLLTTNVTEEQWLVSSFQNNHGLTCSGTLTEQPASYIEMGTEGFVALVKYLKANLNNINSSGRKKRQQITCDGTAFIGWAHVWCDLGGVYDNLYALFGQTQQQFSVVNQILNNQQISINGLTTLLGSTIQVLTNTSNLLMQTRSELADFYNEYTFVKGYVFSNQIELDYTTKANYLVSDEVTQLQALYLNDLLQMPAAYDTNYYNVMAHLLAIYPDVVDYIPSTVGNIALICPSYTNSFDKGLYTIEVNSILPYKVQFGLVSFYGNTSVYCLDTLQTYTMIDPSFTFQAPCKVSLDRMTWTYINGWFTYAGNQSTLSYSVFSTSDIGVIQAQNNRFNYTAYADGNKEVCSYSFCYNTSNEALANSLQQLNALNDAVQATNANLSNSTSSLLQQLSSSIMNTGGYQAITTYGGYTLSGLIFAIIGALISFGMFMKDCFQVMCGKSFRTKVIDVLRSPDMEQFNAQSRAKVA